VDFSLTDGGAALSARDLLPILVGVLAVMGGEMLSWRCRGLFLRLRTLVAELAGPARWRRLTSAYRVLSNQSVLPSYGCVRIAGTVETDALGRSKLCGLMAVAWSYCVRGDYGGLIDGGVDGLDFFLRLADGTLVRVRASAAASRGRLRVAGGRAKTWTGKPLARTESGWFSESRVAPGDHVEVVGFLSKEFDFQSGAPAPRSFPVTYSISAPDRDHLFVSGTPVAALAAVDERSPEPGGIRSSCSS
jgi:hypothetical protein